MHLQSKN